MKTRLAFILVALLVSATCLASCDWLGIGKSKEQERYEREVEAYRQQQEAYQKQIDEYYENLEKSINEYNQQYQEWQESQLQQIAQAEGGEVVIVTDNQTQP
jgi:thiamine biosynthesis lipoprotein ApbE